MGDENRIIVKLIKLEDKRPQIDTVNDDALELIESIIPRIKSGELAAIGISWVDKEGSIGGNTSSGNQNITMFASLEHLSRQFYNEMLEDNGK